MLEWERNPMALALDIIYLAGLVLLSPWLIYRALATGKRPSGFWQKLIGSTIRQKNATLPPPPPEGKEQHFPSPPFGGRGQGEGGHSTTERSARPRAWFHGVSVGEIHLLRQVVREFERRHSDW